MLAQSGASPVPAAGEPLSEIVVTGQRREQPALSYAGNIERLDRGIVDDVRHQHIHQLLARVAGVWISRGSGQEHLTAIRSPVLTGAGSCGGFLFLENGIPILVLDAPHPAFGVDTPEDLERVEKIINGD